MTTKTRKTYIGKEGDEESYLGDFGVRKYDYAAGRFTSPDVLWEKYMTWSPYQYCGNNPISLLDDYEKGATLLSVFNSNGIKIKEYNISDVTGLQSIHLDGKDFYNGLYFIQLQTPTVIENQKLMIIK